MADFPFLFGECTALRSGTLAGLTEEEKERPWGKGVQLLLSLVHLLMSGGVAFPGTKFGPYTSLRMSDFKHK